MAITFTDNRGILDESDSVTGWVATDGPTLFNTVAPTPIEAGACLGMQASNATEDAYTSITSDDYSAGGSLFIWMTDRAAFDTTVNGGIGIQVGDGTNRIGYHVGGSDGAGFRHEVGPVKWTCFQIDLANKPANFSTIAGTEANLNEAAITQVGVYFETIAKSVGGADNVFWDIIRFADNGVGIEIYGGTSGVPEVWETATITDRSTANQAAHGIIRKVGSGAYSIQGNISSGDATGTNDTYINSVGETFLWEDRGQSTNNYYRFNAVGNGTGVTDLNFDGCVWTCPTSGSIDVSDVNVDAFDVRTTVITGFDQGINTGGASNVWSANTFNSCGQIETTGTILSNSTFVGYTGTGDTSQLYWNTTLDPNGELDGCVFTMPATLTHAIEFPTGMTAQSITLTDCVFNGYNVANALNDSTFNVLATTGTLTINIIGGSGSVSYRTAGATVVIVQNPVTTLVTVRDVSTGSPIENARVKLEVSDSLNFPYLASVTITSSADVATVAHTAHGLADGDFISIRGAVENTYNGCYEISGVTINAYDYNMGGATTSPATGTITATFAYFNTLTNASGVVTDTRSISVAQGITGKVRKSTTPPLYKTSPITETVDNTNGLTLNISLISDE
tara:strand:+ start:4780 stop:6645 length:1866 start_codon:yes stop_codon:yes gene_type:complete